MAVIVVRASGSIVLQQRSKSDKWQPGMWTLSCTGHVKSGESYMAAAARELREELGLDVPLTEKKRILVPPISDGRLTEFEWVSLFESISDASIDIDPVELEAAQEFSEYEVRKMMSEGSLTRDAVILLRTYFGELL